MVSLKYPCVTNQADNDVKINNAFVEDQKRKLAKYQELQKQ